MWGIWLLLLAASISSGCCGSRCEPTTVISCDARTCETREESVGQCAEPFVKQPRRLFSHDVRDHGPRTGVYAAEIHDHLDQLPNAGRRLAFGREVVNIMDGSPRWRAVEEALIRYARFHMHQCPRNVTASTQYIAYRCASSRPCDGYSDRLRGMLSSLKLAMGLGRCFIVDIEKPVGMMDVLLPNAIDWRAPTGLHRPTAYYRWGHGDSRWNKTTISAEELTAAFGKSKAEQPQVVVVESNRIFAVESFLPAGNVKTQSGDVGPSSFALTADELQALDAIWQPEAQAIAHNFLFRTRTPGRLLSVHHMLHSARAWGKHLISLHFRTGDKVMRSTLREDQLHVGYTDDELEAILQPVVEAGLRTGGLSVYVASDSMSLTGRVMAMLPADIQGLHCCSKPFHVNLMKNLVKNTHQEAQAAARAMEQIFIDLEMFGNSDAIFVEGAGNFASLGQHWTLNSEVAYFRSTTSAGSLAYLANI